MTINDPKPTRTTRVWNGGRQAARESLAVHGLLLGHEEKQPRSIDTTVDRRQLKPSQSSRPAAQSQRRNQPGRSHLGLGCQGLGRPTSSRATCWCPRTSTISAATVFARQVRFEGGVTIPSIRAERGADRHPASAEHQHLDPPGREEFPAGTAQKLAVRLNIYNALNANTATKCARDPEEFLRPRAIMPPRLAEVSASYSF